MATWNRRDFLKTSLSTGALLSLPGWARAEAEPAAGSRRPNIVFILADDYGIDGVGCYGSDRHRNRTPNLDALAAGGVRFEHCFSTPLCGPTRCQIMTGRYPFRTGGLTNPTAQNPRSRDELSLPRVLRQAGYATCHAGKWRQMSETPGDWGFQEYLTDPTAGGYFWKTSYTRNGQQVQTEKEVYYPDVAHNFAIDFIRRRRNEPFFLYYASHLVHGPILRTPDSAPGTKDEPQLYNDNVAYLDKQVGALVAELDRLGLRENTVILFSGDNGTAFRSGTVGGRQIHGHKGTLLEGGVRVPLIASWKGKLPGGQVLGDLVDFSDVLPTFADLAGMALPPGVTVDGRSFAPRLRGEPGNPRKWVFVQLGRDWYVRDSGWKLTRAGQLLDMKDAPFAEAPVEPGAGGADAEDARRRLQAVLDLLNPAGGKTISAEQAAQEKQRWQRRQQRKKERGKKP